ncbi:MAG: HutD family protein [Firmicutes bacterium]|nr:HutD family protein [Bacillota bacterium]
MNIKIYKSEDFTPSRWTGGTTTQLAIFPQDADYLKRNFIWRLSTATCDLEETTFSKLPDYDRVLMVLKGDVVLAHQDVRVARLGELEQDRFDGGYHTKSFGKITDYNLMTAKGNKGYLDVIELTADSKELEFEKDEELERFDVTFYCRDGYATITAGAETFMLMPGQQMVASFVSGEEVKMSVMGDGTLIRGQIFYDYRPEELGPTVIPTQKTSFEDFKTCIFLANSQFHGAKYIFKSLKTTWYDEALSKGIKKAESLYLTTVVFLLGFLAIAFGGLNTFTEIWQWILVFAGWILADLFVISPLIYLPFMPKPVKPHIKDINNLTPYEQGVYEAEKDRNERVEKIMKKYKNSSAFRNDDN